MPEPLPSNHLFGEELGVYREKPPWCFRINRLTLSTFSRSAVVKTFRVFIATGDPLNVALYTSAVPPVANGVASYSTSVGSSTNEGRRIPNVPHNLRRYLRYLVCFCLGRSPLSRAWMCGQSLIGGGGGFHEMAHQTKTISKFLRVLSFCNFLRVLSFWTPPDPDPTLTKETDEVCLPWFQLSLRSCGSSGRLREVGV